MSAFRISLRLKPKQKSEPGEYAERTTVCKHRTLKIRSSEVRERREALPLYGPDSMMPSVVEAKLLEVTRDSERFGAPGPPGYESCEEKEK